MRRYEATQASIRRDGDESGEPVEEFEDESEEEPEEDPREDQTNSEEEPEEDPEEDQTMDSEELRNGPDKELPQEPSAYSIPGKIKEPDNCLSGLGSKERKRMLDATEPNPDPLKSPKKLRHDDAFKAESNGKSAVSENGESAAKQQENTGSSTKRRHSRWEQQPEQDGKISEVDNTIKRRKSRWDDTDTSKLNKLDPGQLPDFTTGSAVSELDPEVERLKLELREIKVKLLSTEIEDNRPEEQRSPSPLPEYNNLGMRTNSRQMRLRKKLIDRCQHIILMLAKRNLISKTPPPVHETPKLTHKIHIPVEKFPTYNFVGLIMGPRGNTHKKMEKESRAKIHLRGKNSTKSRENDDTSTGEDLHVFIEANSQQSLDAAVAMVEKLLVPVDEQMNHLKRDQLQELAILKGTYNICKICKEQGHRHYACPNNQKSTFDTMKACTTCGSFSHLASICPLIVSPQFGSSPKEVSDRSLYVGYLPQTVDENRLRELFCPFGKIVDVKVIKDRNTGVSKGYGFVNFETSSDAVMAVTHMHGHLMEGKMLVVKVAGHHPVQGAQTPMGLPSVTQLHKYPPGFAAPPVTQSQTAWPRPLISTQTPIGLPSVTQLPKYPPGFAAPPVTQSQTAWPRPLISTPPEVEDVYRTSEGFSLTSSSISSGHINLLAGSKVASILPAVVSNHLRPQHGSGYDSLYRYPNPKPASPPKLPLFPGDPDYPGSQVSQFFGASTQKPSLFDFSQTRDSAGPTSWRP